MTALAISLALAFWAPYHLGPVCPQGVTIQYENFVPDHAGQVVVGAGDCVIELAYWTLRRPYSEQCAYVAHELGHNVFNLEHSSDPDNIMFPHPPTPGACYIRKARSKRAFPV